MFFLESEEYRYRGMLDWISLKIDTSLLPEKFRTAVADRSGRIMKIDYEGNLEWEASAWESIRSDTHQISCHDGTFFQLQGSPARVGLKNNVFGSLNFSYCAEKMISFIAESFGFKRSDLPPLDCWSCTRIDITTNVFLRSEAECKQALLAMKQMPSSRQKVSYEENTVYVGKRSSRKTAKVYLKGQDCLRHQRKKTAFFTDEQLELSKCLLRFELSLKSQYLSEFFKEHTFKDLTPEFLLNLHQDHFSKYLSSVEIVDMGTLLDLLLTVAPTEGQAKAAFDFYLKIRQIGYEQAKATSTLPTFYRNRKHLLAAGLSLSDLTKSNVIPLRTKPIYLSDAVQNWEEIRHLKELEAA